MIQRTKSPGTGLIPNAVASEIPNALCKIMVQRICEPYIF